MSPIAHAGIGLLGWQVADRKKTLGTLFLYVFAANFADIDFLFALVFGPHSLFAHQYYTHNVVFILAGCGLLALALPDRRSRWGLVATGLTHLPLDVIVVDTVAPIGIRMFYPLSDKLYNVGLFPFLERGPWRVLFSLRNALVLGLEFAIFVLPILIIFRRSLAAELRRSEFRRW